MPLESWRDELRRTVRSLDELKRFIAKPSAGMRQAVTRQRLAITPHTLSLIDWSDPHDPIRRLCVPDALELDEHAGEMRDPIGDAAKSPIPFLTHRYPDRVLVLSSFACAQYCRFCFRRDRTGLPTPGPSASDRERMVEYLREHPAVEEVILSGGDPWIAGDAEIDAWLGGVFSVPSVRRVRFHTRVPVVLPSRVTGGLVAVLRRHQGAERPVIVVTHFNHPREIAPENVTALARLADAGISLRNQNVLLRGVNDDATTLAALYRRLVDCRVVPYYLHHLDLAAGTNHFRVPLRRGLAIMRELQGRVTGVALPRYMLDLPGGKGKVPLQHQYLTGNGDGSLDVESPFGETVEYREPLE
jgi:lysine 2,3-aminomutase